MTLIEEAKKGRLSPQIDSVARREMLEPERLARLVAAGRAVISRNISREKPVEMDIGVGEALSVKDNGKEGR